MNDVVITTLLIVALFAILGSGVWIGLSLAGVAWIGMQLFSSRPAGDAMAVTIWGSASSWTLTALPLFIWMGEILFRTRLSNDMFRGLAPWVQALPGRLLHTNVIGCTIFAAVSGSSAATCATIGKMTLPELKRRGYPDDISIGSLAGAGTLGLLIPPSTHCRIKNATRADLLPHVICYPSDGPAGAERRDEANQHGNTQRVGRRTEGAVWRRGVR